ncbi:MAG TPA: NAD(P)/FAD-dependent oxidoreductase [Gemmatimonadaceae bacterium]|nr:NAD(P)/FAD-dependent oxidoreductase [Gemmatimonadaceae bacterium]
MNHDEEGTGQVYDIGIVGGGPAGLSAAIWSARYGRSVVLVDSGDPRSWESRGVNGFLGHPEIRPADLRGKGREELRSYAVTLIDAAVLRIETDGVVDPESGEPLFLFAIEQARSVRARRVLLAIGMRDVWPDIPGLARVYGANAHVCPDCDGYDARDKRVVVIGHGRRAVGMALALTTWTSHITIVTNGCAPDMDDDELQQKLAASGITVRSEAVSSVGHDGDTITCLQLDNGEALDVDKVFFTIAQFPADDLGAQLGCERDRGGHIVTSEHFATSVTSVFAAGDITPGPQLAIRAAAAGSVAAMAMHKSLVPAHRKLESAH